VNLIYHFPLASRRMQLLTKGTQEISIKNACNAGGLWYRNPIGV
jgi:hypothetical protein